MTFFKREQSHTTSYDHIPGKCVKWFSFDGWYAAIFLHQASQAVSICSLASTPHQCQWDVPCMMVRYADFSCLAVCLDLLVSASPLLICLCRKRCGHILWDEVGDTSHCRRRAHLAKLQPPIFALYTCFLGDNLQSICSCLLFDANHAHLHQL